MTANEMIEKLAEALAVSNGTHESFCEKPRIRDAYINEATELLHDTGIIALASGAAVPGEAA